MKINKKIRKTGGSYSVVLPTSIIKLFGINEQIEMEIDVETQSIVIRKKLDEEVNDEQDN